MGELVLEFTNDSVLLKQYHRLYEAEFNYAYNVKYQHDERDLHDEAGYTLVITSGRQCVGGARLSVSTPDRPELLPVEMGSFRLRSHFPQLESTHQRYGQIGRLCLSPEFRGGFTTALLMWHFHRQSLSLGLDIIFGTAPYITARSYVRGLRTIGLMQTAIHGDIEVPPYPMCEAITFYLISIITKSTALAASPRLESKLIQHTAE